MLSLDKPCTRIQRHFVGQAVLLLQGFSLHPQLHLKHSFASGLPLRARAFPIVSLLFAWGDGEGQHTIANMNTSLLGGTARPSLY